ncbi:hypothetical protein [Caballeronia calidae]|uniref:hypothetical protein n=1 Tax=Caballeronia calidae TaxID=1777139 RepID=UPI0007889A1E|nr:hypothetical protein [Caballeronia calidae]
MYQDILAMALYANDIILSVVGAVTGFLLCPCSTRGSARARDLATAFRRFVGQHVPSRAFEGREPRACDERDHRRNFDRAIQQAARRRQDASPLAIASVAGSASDKFFFVDRLAGAMFAQRVDPPAAP